MIEALAAALGVVLGSVLGPPSLTATGVPEPTADVPGAFDEATAAFEARVLRLHPPGSEVEALRQALARDGFDGITGSADEGFAFRGRPGFLCELNWEVRWTAEAGRIESLDALHWGDCL